MRLNPNCVREVMLYIESKLDAYNQVRIDEDFNELSFSAKEVEYTASKLIEGKLLRGETKHFLSVFPSVNVFDITWEGHKLIDNIRDDEVWNAVKSKISKFSSVSIPIIAKIANQTVIQMLNEEIKD